MAVKKGYKQTEVGVIPLEWGVTNLGHLSEFVTSGSRGWATYYSEHGALFVRSQNVRDGKLDFADQQCVRPPSGAEVTRTRVKENDLLITVTGNSVGNVARVSYDLGDAYVSQHVGLVRLINPSEAEYVCRFLAPYSPGNSQISASQSGQSKPGLKLTDLHDFVVAIPPTLAEQQAIAGALSDADAWIESLEQLIAKKRQIKQGAMQELLTGKRRLPGFSGKWETKRLGDLARLYQPTTISSSSFTTFGFPVYGANGIVGFYPSYNHSTWQVTVTCRGSTCGTVNKTVDKCWITGNAMVLNCDHNHELDKSFLFHLLSEQDLTVCITGTGQPQIVRTPLAAVELRLPQKISEQQAIATVLSDMDTELESLESKLAKACEVKQGMMQELLTGRIRLV